MVQTLTGLNRSKGLSYQELLNTASRTGPATPKKQAPLDHAPLSIGVERYRIAQQAFMGTYHVVATHPTLLIEMGDAHAV